MFGVNKNRSEIEVKTASQYIFSIGCLVGIVGIVLYGISNSQSGIWTIFGNSLLIAGGTFFIGVLLGFLFGIPRTLQGDQPQISDKDNHQNNISYKVNTNLEQISDWLTKILVGVGLTQINKLPRLIDNLSKTLKPGLGDQPASGIYGVALVIYFVVFGFLSGYLVTRIFIAEIFRRADENALKKKIDELTQSGFDARALDMTTTQLTADAAGKKFSDEELEDAILKASPNAQFTIFLQAQKLRRETWNNDKSSMEKTLPV